MKSISDIIRDVSKCNRCGNCQYYCPSFNVSRRESHVARGKLQLIRKNLEEGSVYSDTFVKRVEQCLLCGNCSQNCPAGLCTEDIMEDIRELCVAQAGPSKAMAMTAANIAEVGNITGDVRENRLLWMENLEPGSVRVGEQAENLFFAGCVSTLYPSSYAIPQTFSKLMNKAGQDWAVIGKDESCCGYPLIIGGMAESAKSVMEQNIREVVKSGARRLITTCPSCYHVWKEVYPHAAQDMPDIEIYHATEFIEKLVREGALWFNESSCTVTFHDSCDLGRKGGVFEEPRDTLRAIPGVNLVEMKFHHENAFCCGGGGNLEMNDSALSGDIAKQRVKQAQDAGAEIIVTSCQQCKRTLTGGARQMRARIKVMDISEFIFERVNNNADS